MPNAGHAQQRVVADRQHQAGGETRSRASTQRQAEMVDQALEPCRASRQRGQDRRFEALGKDLPLAMSRLAPEAAREKPNANGATRARQVRRLTEVSAMDPPGW